ncbi:normal mucosa of esophagus-specific gene 1 protein isoform X2 [Procambarus clarkii]|uniref:normal mucosa of esophagus-specific gene 1 protein isoform X2 n=1 Tax=Procambarus clarkii TaxID=6728 RepID=UPI001E671303|nr:normal mucosa of esophagus-specific gene 1 protein-like [Procambarus clarkii]
MLSLGVQGCPHSAVGTRLRHTLLTPTPPTGSRITTMVGQDIRSPGFGLHALKRFPEIVPLVSIMGIAIVGVSTWCGYALMTKTDVKLNRNDLSRWDKIDVNKPQKLLTVNQQYGENPEITALKKELAEAYRGH